MGGCAWSCDRLSEVQSEDDSASIGRRLQAAYNAFKKQHLAVGPDNSVHETMLQDAFSDYLDARGLTRDRLAWARHGDRRLCRTFEPGYRTVALANGGLLVRGLAVRTWPQKFMRSERHASRSD